MWFNFRHHLVRLEDLLAGSLDHFIQQYYILTQSETRVGYCKWAGVRAVVNSYGSY